jgi:undecaprenyl-diphosphatase
LKAATLLATLLVLWPVIVPAVRDGVVGLVRPKRFVSSNGGRDALVVLLASIPSAGIALLARPVVEQFARSPTALGFGFLVTTLLLISTRWATSGEAETPPAWGALLLGFVQGLAVLPGISRTGATIAIALWLGVRKDRAFELSMLLSLPAVFGLLFELPELRVDIGRVSAGIVGAAVAFVTGVAALLVLQRAVKQGLFAWFALWVGPLALATLAMAKAWPVR